MKILKKEKGLLSLEASICLTLFLFLMLFLYSYFVVFEARNVMAHAALATADSLSIEVYQTNKLKGEGADALTEVISGIVDWAFGTDNAFRSTDTWFENDDSLSSTWNGNIYAEGGNYVGGTGGDEDFSDDLGRQKAYVSKKFTNALKTRFFAYLTGSDNTEEINAYLEKYHIVGGMDGVSFAGSKIVDGELYIVVTYKLDYEYDVMDLMNITFEQTACSKLWK